MSSLGGFEQRDILRDDRLRAVHRHAERTARELAHERADSVLHLARAFNVIDRDEIVGQFEARLGFLERQVERLSGRREQVDRAVHAELQVMRARITEAIRAVEAASEADRKARQALEVRVRSMIEESEKRSARAAEALRDGLESSWQQTLESERSRRDRARVEALEAELADRAAAARNLIGEIRQSLEAQVVATVRAAHALTGSTSGSVADRPPASRPAGVEVEGEDDLPAPPAADDLAAGPTDSLAAPAPVRWPRTAP